MADGDKSVDVASDIEIQLEVVLGDYDEVEDVKELYREAVASVGSRTPTAIPSSAKPMTGLTQ